jgi:hypothetical protein
VSVQTYQSKKEIKAEAEVDFYAIRCSMDRWDLMELIYLSPEKNWNAPTVISEDNPPRHL